MLDSLLWTLVLINFLLWACPKGREAMSLDMVNPQPLKTPSLRVLLYYKQTMTQSIMYRHQKREKTQLKYCGFWFNEF
jgi:hypothetical protein